MREMRGKIQPIPGQGTKVDKKCQFTNSKFRGITQVLVSGEAQVVVFEN